MKQIARIYYKVGKNDVKIIDWENIRSAEEVPYLYREWVYPNFFYDKKHDQLIVNLSEDEKCILRRGSIFYSDYFGRVIAAMKSAGENLIIVSHQLGKFRALRHGAKHIDI